MLTKDTCKSRYVPTTCEVETAYHEFSSQVAQDEGRSDPDGMRPMSYPEAFVDWQEGMWAFRRWLAAHDAEVRSATREQIANNVELVAEAELMDKPSAFIAGLMLAASIARGGEQS